MICKHSQSNKPSHARVSAEEHERSVPPAAPIHDVHDRNDVQGEQASRTQDLEGQGGRIGLDGLTILELGACLAALAQYHAHIEQQGNPERGS